MPEILDPSELSATPPSHGQTTFDPSELSATPPKASASSTLDVSNPLSPLASLQTGQWQNYPGVRDLNEGAAQIQQPATADKLRGAGKLVRGTLGVASPALAALGLSAPVNAAAWYAASKVIDAGVTAGARKLGVNPEDAQLMGDVASAVPIAYGGYRIAEGKLSAAIDAHNQRAADLLAQDARQGQGVDLGEHIAGPEIPLNGTQGWKVAPNGASKQGRPNYSVQDEQGNILYSGNGREVQIWLASKGVERTPAAMPVSPEPAPLVEQAETVDPAELSAIPPAPKPAPTPAPPPAPAPGHLETLKAAALDHARQNPDASASTLQKQFGLAYGTAQQITALAHAERQAAAAPLPTVGRPSDYEQLGALSNVPSSQNPAAPNEEMPPGQAESWEIPNTEKTQVSNDRYGSEQPTSTPSSPVGHDTGSKQASPQTPTTKSGEMPHEPPTVLDADELSAIPPETPAPRGKAVQGSETRIPVPGEDTTYPARYALRELADVQASHNGESFAPNPDYEHRNDRDYANAANAERVVRQAQNFDPAYLINDNPDAVNGPPVVDTRGNVLGGNSRAMTLQRVYAQDGEAAQRYKDLLTAKSPAFGIDPAQVAAMHQPVLVREASGVEDPQSAITDFNKTGTAALTSSERAVADARRVSPDTLEYLGRQIAEEGDDATLAKVLGGAKGPALVNRLVDDGVLTPQEKPQYLDERGLVTPEGKQRVSRLMVGQFFESPDEFEQAAPALRQNLERIVAPLSRVQDRPDWDVTPQVKQAIGILTEAKARGIRNLDDLETQQDMFGRRAYDPQAVAVAKTLQQGPRKAAEAFQQYASDAELERHGNTLGFLEPPTPEESFEEAFGERALARFSRDLNHTTTPDPKTGRINKDRIYREADWDTVPAHGSKLPVRIRLNWQALKLMADAVLGPGHEAYGLSTLPGEMARYGRMVERHAGREFQRKRIGRDGFAKATALADDLIRIGNDRVVGFLSDGSKPREFRLRAVREELTHWMQSLLGPDGNGIDHVKPSLMMSHRLWPIVRGALLRDGYPDEPHTLVAEAGAKLAAGQTTDLGLTKRGAKILLRHYYAQLAAEHGVDVARQVLQFADTITKEDLKHARIRTHPRTGSGTGPGTGSSIPPDSPRNARRPRVEEAAGGEDRWAAEDAGRDGPGSGAGRGLPGSEAVRRLREGRPGGDGPEVRRDVPGQARFSKHSEESSDEVTPSTTLGSGFGALQPYFDRFWQNDLVPKAKQLAELAHLTKDDFAKVFAPASRGEEAQTAAHIVRANAAELARSTARVERALAAASKYFDSLPEQERWDFIDAIEKGEPQKDPLLQGIANTMRTILDTRRDAIRKLGTGKLENFIEDYFPHLWKQPDKAKEAFANAGKRPLEGSKSFLKQRTVATFAEGLAAGLEPISNNPVDLVFAKAREMDKYLTAHRILGELKERGLLRYVDARDGEIAPGWRKIDDPVATVYGPSVQPITEYPNDGLWSGLERVAEALGIRHERGFENLRGAVGRAYKRDGTIKTAHGSAEDVVAHEIGHQIDWLAGSGKRFVLEYPDAQTAERLRKARQTLKATAGSTLEQRRAAREELASLEGAIAQRKNFAGELRALADLRSGPEAYRRKREEKMAQLAEMWVGARELFERTAPTVFAEWKKFLDENPKLHALRDIEGNTEVRPISQPYDVGGLVIRGHWWAPEPVARVLNHYLSPGLREKSAAFRSYLGAGNLLNQAQLGFSAFHLAFTTIDVATSRLALGLYQTAKGDVLKGLKTAAETPASPFTNLVLGDRVLKEYYAPGTQGARIAALVDAMVQAGGRAHMDSFYQTQLTKQMLQAWRAGNVLGAGLRAPFAAFEQIARPLMEYIVPRQKLGVFANLAQYELGRLGPDATQDEQRAALARAWDSVDNRLGQLVYDNLFWHKIVKDLSMASVRSVGWNLGTIREVAGGVGDTMKFAGGKGDFTHRMSYIVALPFIAGLLGGLLYYYWHGKAPEDTLDYYLPRDREGHRWNLPTYMKDVFHWGTDPVGTASGKIHPLLTTIVEMLENRDFHHKPILHAHDPLVQKAEELAKFAAGQFLPISVRGNQPKGHTPSTEEKVLPFFGVTKASKSLDQLGH